MFLQLARPESTVPPAGGKNPDYFNTAIDSTRANAILGAQPQELNWLIERVWEKHSVRKQVATPFQSQFRLETNSDSKSSPSGILSIFGNESEKLASRDIELPHLIYAYMIENTRVYEIFGQVLERALHDEQIGIANPTAQVWLRSTEELFYSAAAHGFLHRITSDIRPDQRAVRRNAYQRMFGLDLNHGTTDGKSYPYVKARRYNTNFVNLFEELLREVWKGIAFIRSVAGINETDDAKITDLVRQIRDMLHERRSGGNLSREEFASVAAMSWMHLSVMSPSAIFTSLGINAATPLERLTQAGERAGYPAHPRADSFLQMAEPISAILIGIESQAFDGDAASNLYLSEVSRSHIQTIITHWSIATGRNLKARDVNQMPASAMVR